MELHQVLNNKTKPASLSFLPIQQTSNYWFNLKGKITKTASKTIYLNQWFPRHDLEAKNIAIVPQKHVKQHMNCITFEVFSIRSLHGSAAKLRTESSF